jgi:hypothetical protein
MTASDCVPTASRTRSLATASASLPIGDAVADVVTRWLARVKGRSRGRGRPRDRTRPESDFLRPHHYESQSPAVCVLVRISPSEG